MSRRIAVKSRLTGAVGQLNRRLEGEPFFRLAKTATCPPKPWRRWKQAILVLSSIQLDAERWIKRRSKPSRVFRQRLAVAFCRLCLGLVLIPLNSAWSSEIRTVAGTGVAGYSGDGGPADKARLNSPFGVVKGPDGALYVCDTLNHCIRKVSADGLISTVAGSGEMGYSGDGGPATGARLNQPYEVRFDREGHMLIVEMENHIIRRVDAGTGEISTVAGTGQRGYGGDGGPATEARLSRPHSIQLGPDGTLYVCDIGNHRIRMIDSKTGVISTLAGNGEQKATPDGAAFSSVPLKGPRAIDFDGDGNLWLALREGNAVYKLDLAAGTLHHRAGNGQKGFTGNGGPAKAATLSGPKGISVGPAGNIYLADTESHSVRMINVTEGRLSLVAGTGRRGDGPEGDPLNCRMGRPHGIYVDGAGSIFIGDTLAHRVRIITK